MSADANQLLLKDIHGKPANLNRLLEKTGESHLCGLLGKLVCALPGRDASLGKAERTVQGKDVVFVYLAFKDQESSWKMAVEQEGLSEVPDNFFITNPKNRQNDWKS